MSGFERLLAGRLPRLVMFDLDGTLVDSVPDLAAAVDEMLFRTSTRRAPWTIVAANSKEYARTTVLKTVAEAMEKAL